MQFANWHELIRFRPAQTKRRFEELAKQVADRDICIEFAAFWKRKNTALPFPETSDFDEFLNEEI